MRRAGESDVASREEYRPAPLLYQPRMTHNNEEMNVEEEEEECRVHWGLFYYQHPVATFRVDMTRRCVTLTPIFSSDQYEIMRYIVY